MQFGIAFPSGLSFFLNIFGNPMSTMTYSLECFLKNFINIFGNVIYLKMMVAMVMPLAFLLIYFLLYCL